MLTRRLVYFECDIEGHDSNLLNQVCIDTQCTKRGLICLFCQYHHHKNHETRPLRIFLSDFESAISKLREAEQFQQDSNASSMNDHYNSIIECLVLFQNIMNEQFNTLAGQLKYASLQRSKRGNNLKYQNDKDGSMRVIEAFERIQNNECCSSEEQLNCVKVLVSRVTSGNMSLQLKTPKDIFESKEKKENLAEMEVCQGKIAQAMSKITDELAFISKQVKLIVDKDNKESNKNNTSCDTDSTMEYEEGELKKLERFLAPETARSVSRAQPILQKGNRSEMEDMFLGKNQPTRLVSKEDSIDMEQLFNSQWAQQQQLQEDTRHSMANRPIVIKKETNNERIIEENFEEDSEESQKNNNSKDLFKQPPQKKSLKDQQNLQQQQQQLQQLLSQKLKKPSTEKLITRASEDILETNKKPTTPTKADLEHIIEQHPHDNTSNCQSQSNFINFIEESHKFLEMNTQLPLITTKRHPSLPIGTLPSSLAASQPTEHQQLQQISDSQSNLNKFSSSYTQQEVNLDIKVGVKFKAHSGITKDVVFLDDTKIATCSYDRQVRVWDYVQKKLLATLKGHEGRIVQLKHSLKHKIIGSCGKDKSVCLWNDNGAYALVTKLNYHNDAVMTLEFIDSKNFLATGSADKTIRITCMLTYRLLFKVEDTGDTVLQLRYDVFNDCVLSAGYGKIQVYAFAVVEEDEEGKKQKSSVSRSSSTSKDQQKKEQSSKEILKQKAQLRKVTEFAAHTDAINMIEPIMINEKQYLLSCSDDKTLKLWDFDSLAVIQSISEDTMISAFCFFEKLGIIVVSMWGYHGGGHTAFYDFSDFSKIQDIESIETGTTSLKTNREQNKLVSSHENGEIQVYYLKY